MESLLAFKIWSFYSGSSWQFFSWSSHKEDRIVQSYFAWIVTNSIMWNRQIYLAALGLLVHCLHRFRCMDCRFRRLTVPRQCTSGFAGVFCEKMLKGGRYAPEIQGRRFNLTSRQLEHVSAKYSAWSSWICVRYRRYVASHLTWDHLCNELVWTLILTTTSRRPPHRLYKSYNGRIFPGLNLTVRYEELKTFFNRVTHTWRGSLFACIQLGVCW